ncbi:MAG: PQ-loop domain-containing transporter [Sedimentibacter sp.]
MSIFEMLMLLCFGAAWPFSIYKSYKSKSVDGKSPYFLVILILGYIFGILNKIFYNLDFIVYLYGINLIMVSIDLILYLKNSKLIKSE